MVSRPSPPVRYEKFRPSRRGHEFEIYNYKANEPEGDRAIETAHPWGYISPFADLRI